MTDHLKPYEPAARILCQMDGVNPDALTQRPHPLFPNIVDQVPQWHAAAEALIGLSKMLTAMKLAAELPPAQQDGAQMLLPFPSTH